MTLRSSSPQLADDYDDLYKVVLIGDCGVGKSNIVMRYTRDKFNSMPQPTVGCEFASKDITVSSKTIRLQLWDTAGQERYRTITSAYYRGSSGVVMVYDITSYATFQNLDSWLRELKDFTNNDVVIILVGNKSDLSNRQVRKEEAATYAQQNRFLFLESSAATNANISDMFQLLANEIYQVKPKGDYDYLQNSNIIRPGIESYGDPRLLNKQHKPCCLSNS